MFYEYLYNIKFIILFTDIDLNLLFNKKINRKNLVYCNLCGFGNSKTNNLNFKTDSQVLCFA